MKQRTQLFKVGDLVFATKHHTVFDDDIPRIVLAVDQQTQSMVLLHGYGRGELKPYVSRGHSAWVFHWNTDAIDVFSYRSWSHETYRRHQEASRG